MRVVLTKTSLCNQTFPHTNFSVLASFSVPVYERQLFLQIYPLCQSYREFQRKYVIRWNFLPSAKLTLNHFQFVLVIHDLVSLYPRGDFKQLSAIITSYYLASKQSAASRPRAGPNL